MQIDEVHRLILLGVNKTQAGYLSPTEIDDFFNRAQRAEFAYLVQMYAGTRKIHRDLSPFKVAATATSTATGYVDTPDNLEFLIAAMSSSNRPINIKTEAQVPNILSSALTSPSDSYPIAEEQEDGFQIYPKQQWTDVVYWYLATPTDVLYSHTISGRSITYDESTSVHPQWEGAALERVINRAIELGAEYLQTQYVDQKMQVKNERGS